MQFETLDTEAEAICAALLIGASKVSVNGVDIYLSRYKFDRAKQGKKGAQELSKQIASTLYEPAIKIPPNKQSVLKVSNRQTNMGRVVNGVRYIV